MTSQAVIIVDDSDTSRISYNSSSWLPVGSNNEHNYTTHYFWDSQAEGTFSFSFNGTAMYVYGTVPNNGSGPTSAQVVCTVDGVVQPLHVILTQAMNVYNFQYCSAFDLLDTQEHQLVATVSAPQSPFYLDYILYDYPIQSALGAVPQGSVAQVVVDDDSDEITYGGSSGSTSWIVIDADSNSYGSALHSTTIGGSTATFNFNGTQVQVYGAIPPGSAQTSVTSMYQVDNGASVPFVGIPSSPSSGIYQRRFFESDILADGEHTLTITKEIDQGEVAYWLDFIIYSTSSSFVQSPLLSSNIPAIGSTDSPGIPTSASTGDSSGTISRSPTSNSQASSHNTASLITGVVVAAIVLLLCLLLGILLAYRHRTTRQYYHRQHLLSLSSSLAHGDQPCAVSDASPQNGGTHSVDLSSTNFGTRLFSLPPPSYHTIYISRQAQTIDSLSTYES